MAKNPLKLGMTEKERKDTISDVVSKRVQTSYNPVKGPITKYCPSYCVALVKHLRSGKSLVEFLYKIGVTESTFNKWMDRHPDFKDTVEIAVMGEQVWWETAARMQAVGEIKGSANLLWNVLTSKFPEHFKNKQEMDVNTNVVFHIDSGIKRPGDPDYVELDPNDFKEVPVAPKEVEPPAKKSDLL